MKTLLEIIFLRYLRIAPSICVALLLVVSLNYVFADGSQWYEISNLIDTCKEDWWATVLLQNDIYPLL